MAELPPGGIAAGAGGTVALAVAVVLVLREAMRIRPLNAREQDELQQALRQLQSNSEASDALGSLQHDPGLAPPSENDARAGEGGFTPSSPTPTPPGFTPAPPQANVLPGRPAEEQAPTVLQKDRNERLEGGARTNTRRARNAAETADPRVPQNLERAEWEAHHLINLAGIKAFPDLIHAAEQAGWRTDDASNVAPLPASPEAQRKLGEAGIDLPVHDNAHPKWNAIVEKELSEIKKPLDHAVFTEGSDAYGTRAREELEKLQEDLRQRMLELKRLTQNGLAGSPAPV
jgi:hypothetical protein